MGTSVSAPGSISAREQAHVGVGGNTAVDDAVPPARLGLIEALVGALEQRVVICAVARTAGDADADRHLALVAGAGVGDPAADALGHGMRFHRIDALGNDHELLTAEAV